MKKVILAILLVLIFLLYGCGTEKTSYTREDLVIVENQGTEITISGKDFVMVVADKKLQKSAIGTTFSGIVIRKYDFKGTPIEITVINDTNQ